MKATVSLEGILATLLPLSTRNKLWLADRLYAAVQEEKSAAQIEREKIEADIKEALLDVRLGNTFPARDLFAHIDND